MAFPGGLGKLRKEIDSQVEGRGPVDRYGHIRFRLASRPALRCGAGGVMRKLAWLCLNQPERPQLPKDRDEGVRV